MNQISSSSQQPVLGAAYMIGAGITFAAVNIITPIVTYQMGVASSSVVFWQYVIATIFALPLIFRLGGLASMKTRHPVLHEIRAFVSALGVQAWAFGFASGVPLWQMIALSMTAPFFVVAGATVFLGEKLTIQRAAAVGAGFIGALIVTQVWSTTFAWTALLPIIAAALWATATVLTRYLAREEAAESITLYMLVLITPNHLLIGLLLMIGIAVLPAGTLPSGLATGFDFGLPGGNPFWLVVLLGLITAGSQYLLSLAYKVADATYLQPFDDLKLPLNLLLGWVVLNQVPDAWFWPGAALIVGASLYIMRQEAQRRRLATA